MVLVSQVLVLVLASLVLVLVLVLVGLVLVIVLACPVLVNITAKTSTTHILRPFSGSARVSRHQNTTVVDVVGARMMEMVMTTGAVRHVQSNCHHQQTNT